MPLNMGHSDLHGKWIFGKDFPEKVTRLAEQWFKEVHCTTITIYIIFKHNRLKIKIQTCQKHRIHKLKLIKENYTMQI